MELSQKSLTGIQKFFLFQVPMNIQKDWKAKLESAYSFMLKYSKITVCWTSFHLTDPHKQQQILYLLKKQNNERIKTSIQEPEENNSAAPRASIVRNLSRFQNNKYRGRREFLT